VLLQGIVHFGVLHLPAQTFGPAAVACQAPRCEARLRSLPSHTVSLPLRTSFRFCCLVEYLRGCWRRFLAKADCFDGRGALEILLDKLDLGAGPGPRTRTILPTFFKTVLVSGGVLSLKLLSGETLRYGIRFKACTMESANAFSGEFRPLAGDIEPGALAPALSMFKG